MRELLEVGSWRRCLPRGCGHERRRTVLSVREVEAHAFENMQRFLRELEPAEFGRRYLGTRPVAWNDVPVTGLRGAHTEGEVQEELNRIVGLAGLGSDVGYRDTLAANGRYAGSALHKIDGCLVWRPPELKNEGDSARVQHAEVVSCFELKQSFTEAAHKHAWGQLNDRVAAMLRAQPERTHVVVFCAAREGIEFYAARGWLWEARTRRCPWTADALGLLRCFLAMPAEQHGFVGGAARAAEALLKELAPDGDGAVLRQPAPQRACILRVGAYVVKAHRQPDPRDAEAQALTVLRDVPGVPRLERELSDVVGWHLLWMSPVAAPLSEKPYSSVLLRAVASRCSSVLYAAHSRGWVHRDVSPGNILVTADGDVVLGDWGSARRIGSATDLVGTTPSFATVRPQARVHPLDDWWSLLFVLYSFAARPSALKLDELDDNGRLGAVTDPVGQTVDPEWAELLRDLCAAVVQRTDDAGICAVLRRHVDL